MNALIVLLLASVPAALAQCAVSGAVDNGNNYRLLNGVYTEQASTCNGFPVWKYTTASNQVVYLRATSDTSWLSCPTCGNPPGWVIASSQCPSVTDTYHAFIYRNTSALPSDAVNDFPAYTNSWWQVSATSLQFEVSLTMAVTCGAAAYLVAAGDPAAVDAPCFAAETTTACKLTGDVSPAEARRQCYDETKGADAELVLMKTLAAGDVVLAADASGALSLERVVVNQHKANPRASALLELHHSAGVLALTPDHVLLVDGAFAPARDAKPGSALTLADGTTAVVERVAAAHGAVINPVTAGGTVLAGGVVAATHPEWSWAFMSASKSPLPLFYAASAAFPATTQAYYDTVLEPLFDALGEKIKPAALGASVLVLPFVAADAAAAAGLAIYAAAAPAALLAVVLGAIGASKLRACKA